MLIILLLSKFIKYKISVLKKKIIKSKDMFTGIDSLITLVMALSMK